MSILYACGRLLNIGYQVSLPVVTVPGRTRTAWEYLKLRTRALVMGRLLRRKPGAQKIFGYTVFPDTYPQFGMLVSEIFVIREYEFGAAEKRGLIIDCGGNIGLASLYFAMQNPGARIIVFEPAPGTFARLKKMKEVNKLDQIELHNAAVAENEGEIDFYLDDRDDASGIASKFAEFSAASTKVRVRAVKLSNYIHGPVDYLKIDIEGAETEVLHELAGSGKLRLVDRIVMEYHHHSPPDRDELSGLLRLLEDNRFGYIFQANGSRPLRLGEQQPFMIYAYRKS